MHTTKILLGTLLVAASASSFAVNTADLKVIGTIVPSACVPVFTGGDTLNYGDIGAGTLSPTDFTYLGKRSTSLTLTCDEPTRVAVSSIDGRAGSAPVGLAPFIGTAIGFAGLGVAHQYGLGLVDGKQVGSYIISLNKTTALGDGNPVNSFHSDSLGSTWVDGVFEVAVSDRDRLHSWGATGTIVPLAYTVIVQPIDVFAGLNKVADLPDLTDAVPLNGLAAFTVRYL